MTISLQAGRRRLADAALLNTGMESNHDRTTRPRRLAACLDVRWTACLVAVMSAHTPGPWHRNIRAGGKYPTVFAGRNTHVAVAQQMPAPKETEANISLIAAAPELLNALSDMLSAYAPHADRSKPDELHSAVRAAIAAITKATE
jgi:hypothetical protein